MWYLEVQKQAAAKVAEVLAKPMPAGSDEEVAAAFERGETPLTLGDCDAFDPWGLFPALYGSYSSDFDTCAMDVLKEILAGETVRDDLAARMFREMLCRAELCEYGTSPRTCWATTYFQPLLPRLIEKWEAYCLVSWA